MTTATPEEIKTLPIVPDVALQYRCGDNIQFSYMYGILPFTAYPSRIPTTAKYIYVLSDHPSRALHAAYTSKCQMILQGLFEFLKKERPQATIVVKRGGDLFLDYARLAFAKVTICSASTYCLWPALASIGKSITSLPTLPLHTYLYTSLQSNISLIHSNPTFDSNHLPLSTLDTDLIEP